jgi:hypothetical protein
VSGATLTPTDPTKLVSVPGGATGPAGLLLGSGTAKVRLQTQNTTPATMLLSINRDVGTGAQDDAAKASWQLNMGPISDNLSVNRSPAGSGTLSALLTVDATGNLTIAGSRAYVSPKLTFAADPTQAYIAANQSGSPGYESGKPTWIAALNYTSDQVLFMRQGGTVCYLGNVGDLWIASATATKASGTTWANPSDPRLKEDVAPYAAGLAELLRLEPITYHLKAQPDGPLCYGFDASAVREVLPECVSTMKMKLDPADEEETDDVLTFDMHPILVALVNAVKELAARVAALEAR